MEGAEPEQLERVERALRNANRVSVLCCLVVVAALGLVALTFYTTQRRIQEVTALYVMKAAMLKHYGPNIVANSIVLGGVDGHVIINDQGITLYSPATVTVMLPQSKRLRIENISWPAAFAASCHLNRSAAAESALLLPAQGPSGDAVAPLAAGVQTQGGDN